MNFKQQLEGPELPFPSLHDENDVQPLQLQPLKVEPPKQQWNVTTASAVPLAFNFNQSPHPQTATRRYTPNDEDQSTEKS